MNAIPRWLKIAPRGVEGLNPWHFAATLWQTTWTDLAMKKALRSSWEAPRWEAVRKLRNCPPAAGELRAALSTSGYGISNVWYTFRHLQNGIFSLKTSDSPSHWLFLPWGDQMLQIGAHNSFLFAVTNVYAKSTIALTVEFWVCFLPPSFLHFIVACSRVETLSPLQG